MTISLNATRTRTSTVTSSASLNTCCYLWPGAVGVNTWWSNSVNLTTATVVTTWIKYNDTIVPGNSTTIYVTNATSFYGSMGGGMISTWSEVGPPISTTTVSGCAYDNVHDPCTQSTTSVVTIRSHSYYAYPTTTISGVPNGLLPLAADLLYGSTYIGNATAATFPSQSLTIQSPTPFFQFRGIGLYTSIECVTPYEVTSTSQYIRTTINGTLVKTTSFFPTYTRTPHPISVAFDGGNVRGDNATIARPFPPGDYSNFNFTAWMEGIETGASAGLVDAYTFQLDDDLAEYFAGIPWLSEMFTDVDIATCQPLLGGGEPSVHVPVNQLIATDHKTITSAGTMPKPTTAEPTAEPTAESPIVQPTGGDTLDQPEPTTSPDTQPAETSNVPQPRPEPEPTTPSNDQPANTASPDQPDQPTQQPTALPVENGDEPDDSNNAGTTAPPAQAQDPSPAEPTSANVGDIIASVIGLVPGAGSDQQEEGSQQDGQQQEGSSPGTDSNNQPEQQDGGSSPDTQPQQQDGQSVAPPAITIGNSVVTANTASEFEIGGQTLAPGGPAITAAGTTFEIPSDGTAIVVNGNTSPININTPQAQAQPVASAVTIGNNVVTANSASEFVVGSQTLAPGASAITADGTTFAIPSGGSAVVVNGVTSPISIPDVQAAQTPAPQITVGGSTIGADDSGNFVVGSQTLAPGGSAITVDGSTLSLAPSGTGLVVNGETSPIDIPQGAPVTIGGELATPVASGAYVLPGGETLSAGGSAVTVDGTTYSLAPSGSVVVNGMTSALPVAGGTITDAPELVLSGTTLAPGSSAVIDGTTYSLPATGGGIYINGESSALPTASPGSPITLPNGVVATPTAVSEVVIGSQTLVPGGSAITVSGTTYSISGSEVVVAAASTTYTEDIDDFEATATSSRRTSSGRTSSPTITSTEGSESATGADAPSATSTSGASKSIGLLDAMCVAICSVAFLMFLM
ncbi:hypothetical protein PRZ48_007217 [Zasmidium cellare]|uniref:Uncharacterized protein n=1 Tax=Zasmidium cellare TaxID=395010 RepID=A0ABR0EJM7_ZASCE|nr:hypothetical protein PRZ48_007217 [Zasmidium cellare]